MTRAAVVKQKDFLKGVYKSRKAGKKIQGADQKQLKALAFAVHLVINKKVPLTKKIAKYFSGLKKSKIASLKHFFGEKSQITALIKSEKKYQIKIIKRFIHLIKILLTSFFAPDNDKISETDQKDLA